MEAKDTILKKIIEGTNQYVVPLFQRTYSWDKREWKQLWEDLMDLYNYENSHNHFLGSIVTMPTKSVPEGVTKYLLIDGQQRLTTLFILLSLIRDINRKKQEDKILSDEIHKTLLVNQFKTGDDHYKLLPTQGDRQGYMSIINENSSDNNDLEINRSYFYFEKCLLENKDLNLRKLMDVIVSKLVLVSIVLDLADNPHVIFESLNAKGRPLTQADLIRNYFLMKIPVNQQDDIYYNLWKPMQDKLETLEDMTEYIRHFLMRDGYLVKKNEVYYTLIQKVGNRDVLEYLKELGNFSNFYSRLLSPANETNKEISKRLKILNRIEVTTAYPFLLNIYKDYSQQKISDRQFVQILDIIENFMVRRFICKIPTNALNNIFPSLYKQITSNIYSDIVNALADTLSTKGYPRDSEFEDWFVSGKLYTHGDNIDKTKLILEKLEGSFEHHEIIDFINISIEHIMPQTLTDWWKNHLGENFEVEHEEWLHSVGNLTLTGYNSNLSNYDFHAKKTILIDSHLELNRYFATINKWDEEEIHKRGELLAERALKIWPYFGSSQEKKDDSIKFESLPTHEDIMLPLLKMMADNKKHTNQEIYEYIANTFRLTEAEKIARLRISEKIHYQNRVRWAIFYLGKAGLIEKMERSVVKITPRGMEALEENRNTINEQYLLQFPEFRKFKNI